MHILLCDYMKRIYKKDYYYGMGTLIDVDDEITFKTKNSNALNIYYEKLLLHYKEYLNINQRYYITCSKGVKSAKVVRLLELYGYDVTQVIN